MKLYGYEDSDGPSHASLYREVIGYLRGKRAVSHEIDVWTLDDFMLRNNISSISLLKIDAEGNELAVLEGAKIVIAQGTISA